MNILDVLQNSPIDLSSVKQMLEGAGTSKLIIAGDVNAAVLTLMDGLGLGCAELAGVQQPCVVECVYGDALHICLNGEQAVRCTGMADMAERLTWPENRGATVRIACPHALFGWEKLIFVVLDGQTCLDQLESSAAGATGAVIVLDGSTAPSSAVYGYARWLAQVCGIQAATSVLVCGQSDRLNKQPAAALSLQMGVELPVVSCNTRTQSIAGALEAAVSGMGERTNGEFGLYKSAAQQAIRLLEAEKARLEPLCALPEKPGRSLAECFEAEISGGRREMEALVTTTMANELCAEIRDFGIFFQKEMEGVLLAAVEELENPKDAMRAFVQGYVDHVLSAYGRELLNALVQERLMPEAQAIYDRIFDRAWVVRNGSGGEALASPQMQRIQSAIGQMRQRGHALFAGAITSLLIYLNPLRAIMPSTYRSADALAVELQAMLTPAKSYARTKSRQMVQMLNEAIPHYQSMLTDSVLPNLREDLLEWFDRQTAGDLERLRALDEKARRDYDQFAAQAEKNGERVKAIERVCRELQPWLTDERRAQKDE